MNSKYIMIIRLRQ